MADERREATGSTIGDATLLAPLTSGERALLDRLLLRMERRGDFPAFVRNVTTVSRKADYASSYSAGQLGDEILRDYGLTAKLLRLVNTSYYDRLGKRVTKVSRAVVLLGFDKVRSVALGIALHKPADRDASSRSVGENAVDALACGEIARRLARSAGLKDAEEAHVCAMYRDLGRHLVAHYLPDDHAKILAVSAASGMDYEQAATRVLGMSSRRIGIGLVRTWRLSDRLAASMVPADSGTRGERDEDRLRIVTTFAHELHALVATTPEASRDEALTALVDRYRGRFPVSVKRVRETLGVVQRILAERLPVVHGLDPSQSAFLRHAAAFTGVALEGRPASMRPPTGTSFAPPSRRSLAPPGRASMVPPASSEAGSTRLRPAIEGPDGALLVTARIGELVAELEASVDAVATLRASLKAFARAFGFRHAAVLEPIDQRRSLRVQAAYGEAARSLEEDFGLPLARTARPDDLFSTAWHVPKDVIVPNAFEDRVVAKIPRAYFEVVGSAAFALFRCASPAWDTRLILVDTDFPARLPGPEHAEFVEQFRDLIGRAAAAGGPRRAPRVRPFVPRRL